MIEVCLIDPISSLNCVVSDRVVVENLGLTRLVANHLQTS